MKRLKVLAPVCAAMLVAAVGASAGSAAGDVYVSNGSPPGWFSHNKQNEPANAIDQAHPTQYAAAGSNDEIDIEDCNPGNPQSCPFTPGVGVSGVYLSTDGGNTYQQPIYPGYSARTCNFDAPNSTCTPLTPAQGGRIGTLPRYYENGLVSDGDPALAFGPRPDGRGGFSYTNGSRLYYVNLTSNFANSKRDETFKGFEAIAASRLDTGDFGRAIGGDSTAWKDPVIVSKQNSALFSDKEAVWADNAQLSSPFFGNAYVCNTAFRGQEKGNAAPEPILFYRSTDGGDTWSNPVQLTAATNNNQTGGRQSCTIRTDSHGVVYVYFEGFDKQSGQNVFFQVRSFNGGQTFDRPQIVTTVVECGLSDPATGRFSFDGVAGARTDSFPSVDIANGAPTGSDATNEIVMTFCNGPTPSDTSPGPNEQALVKYSTNGGNGPFTLAGSASPASDRPDFPAIAISPNGTDVYVTYDNFLQPWQSSPLAPPRLMQAVVRHADVAAAVPGAFADLFRGPTGDARSSSQNGLTAEFLGDYNYAVATRTAGLAVYNDVRNGSDCPLVDAYRASVTGTGPSASKPSPNSDCAPTFGNSDIFGGLFPAP